MQFPAVRQLAISGLFCGVAVLFNLSHFQTRILEKCVQSNWHNITIDLRKCLILWVVFNTSTQRSFVEMPEPMSLLFVLYGILFFSLTVVGGWWLGSGQATMKSQFFYIFNHVAILWLDMVHQYHYQMSKPEVIISCRKQRSDEIDISIFLNKSHCLCLVYNLMKRIDIDLALTIVCHKNK